MFEVLTVFYNISWYNGDREIIHGIDIIDALLQAGYSQFHILVIRSFEELKEDVLMQ